MKPFFRWLALLVSPLAALTPGWLPVENQVAEATKSKKVAVVHLWATWCPNCAAEHREGGWKKFIEANPEVDVIFVTVRDEKDGRSPPAISSAERHGTS